MSRAGRGAIGLLPLAGLGAAVLLAFSIGRFPVGPGDLLRGLVAAAGGGVSPLDPATSAVLFSIRGPRVLAAILVGGGLSLAGAAFQGLFRNPLVSPDLLGASSGAALGVVCGILLGWPVAAIGGLGFAGGLAAVASVYAIGASLRGEDTALALILTGIVVGSLLGAGIGLAKYVADPFNQLPAITFWLLGSLAGTGPADIPPLLLPVLGGGAVLLLLRWHMNALSLPDDEARALGLPTGALRIAVVAAATAITAASVAAAGIVGWVGLVVPHLARFLVGPGFPRLLPTAALLGAAYLLLIDTAARGIASVEIPLGILTAIVGTPVFIALLARSRGGWS